MYKFDSSIIKLANIEMLGHNKSRIPGLFRSVSTSNWKYSNHYDALGVTPKATQSEIKSAYYKLSKIYHPDKSDDETSAKKFRAISEAYEVLGNIKLKKLYDKGLMVGHQNTSRMGYQPEPEPTDPSLKFYKSRLKSHIIPTMDGKVPIYDFDSWAKNHYGDLFKKSQYDKDLVNKKKRKIKALNTASKQEAILYLVFIICGVLLMSGVGSTDYDKDTTRHIKNDAKPNQNLSLD